MLKINLEWEKIAKNRWKLNKKSIKKIEDEKNLSKTMKKNEKNIENLM